MRILVYVILTKKMQTTTHAPLFPFYTSLYFQHFMFTNKSRYISIMIHTLVIFNYIVNYTIADLAFSEHSLQGQYTLTEYLQERRTYFDQ